MKIIISSDHAGFEVKKKLKAHLADKGHNTRDYGPNEYNPKDDYPDFIIPAVKNLQKDPDTFAIVMCRNGVGVSMLANKFKRVRAALCFHKKQAETARRDDDANVLAIPTDYLSDEEIIDITDAFINTKFSGLERHKRRLKKVSLLEDNNFN